MPAPTAKIRAHAKQLLQLSLENGVISAERVAGVLAYLQKNPPTGYSALLQTYHKLVAVELAKGEARIEHAGAVAPEALAGIAAALGRRYGRAVTPVAKPNPALIAGLRVRIADDVYESSVAGQLAALRGAA